MKSVSMFLPRMTVLEIGTIALVAIYQCVDFAITSLPAPNEDEIDKLIAPLEKYACVVEVDGMHVFPAYVEKPHKGWCW